MSLLLTSTVIMTLYQFDMTASVCDWLPLFGRENNRDPGDLQSGTAYELSGLTGRWEFSGHINGRRSWAQTSCIDPDFKDENCNLSGKQLFYDDNHGWMFTGDELTEPSVCLDDDNNGVKYYSNPAGCDLWSGIPESISGELDDGTDYPVFWGSDRDCDDLPKKLCVSGADHPMAKLEGIYMNGVYELEEWKRDSNGNQFYKLVSCADGEPCNLAEDMTVGSTFINGAVTRIAISNNYERNQPYWSLRIETRFSFPTPSKDYQQEIYDCEDTDPKASPDLCESWYYVTITRC